MHFVFLGAAPNLAPCSYAHGPLASAALRFHLHKGGRRARRVAPRELRVNDLRTTSGSNTNGRLVTTTDDANQWDAPWAPCGPRRAPYAGPTLRPHASTWPMQHTGQMWSYAHPNGAHAAPEAVTWARAWAHLGSLGSRVVPRPQRSGPNGGHSLRYLVHNKFAF